MNTRKIFALNRKAEKEAQKAVDKIYKKYSKEINELIAKEIPKDNKILMYNGLCIITDKEYNKLNSGKGWGRFGDDIQLDNLATLQYSAQIDGNFTLKTELNGTKP